MTFFLENFFQNFINNLKNSYLKIHIEGEKKILKFSQDRDKYRKVFQNLNREVFDEIQSDKKKLNFMNSIADKTTNVRYHSFPFLISSFSSFLPSLLFGSNL